MFVLAHEDSNKWRLSSCATEVHAYFKVLLYDISVNVIQIIYQMAESYKVKAANILSEL